ncbi:MAG: right-handed parallel beta-helix repeat-containing protein, partial [Planctomycetota bacterium]
LILVEDEFTRIEWLQFARVQIGDYSAIYFSDSPSGSDGTVSNVMVYGCWFSGAMSGVRAMAPNITVRNSFFRASGHNGISVDTAGATALIENCTIYGCTQGVSTGIGTDVSIRNTIAVNSSNSDFELFALISYFGYNMYSTTSGFNPASYQGNNQSPPTDLEDLFILLGGAYDLHLEPVGHTAVNGGDDLSATFTGDVDAETRSGLEWDIGADEIPPTPRVMTWQEVDPQ